MSEELKKCREHIDQIDDQLLRLLNQRAGLAQQIGHLKDNGAVLRPEREAQILRRLQQANPGPLSNDAVAQLYTEIMSQCRALEAPLKVAYLGPQGTFSEAAMRKRFGHATEGMPCATFDEIFRAVEGGSANYGVVPVENSNEGMIGHNLDLLLQTERARVCGEVMLPVHQCLISRCSGMDAIRHGVLPSAIVRAMPELAECEPAQGGAQPGLQQRGSGAPGCRASRQRGDRRQKCGRAVWSGCARPEHRG